MSGTQLCASEGNGVLEEPQLGGFARRDHPGKGMRPTVRFVLAMIITIAWVGFAVWASDPWRDDLDQAIGPIASWLIPLLLAYIPGLVIGFMAATLVVSPYHEPSLAPPADGVAGDHRADRRPGRGGVDRADAGVRRPVRLRR